MTKKNRINFTQARIRDLAPKGTSDQILFDLEIPELFCRISKKGRKSFVVSKWSSARQQGTRVTLGRFPSISVAEARQQARRVIADIEAGHDIHADRRKKETAKATLAECLEMYLDNRSLKPTTVKDYHYKIHHDLVEWVDTPVAEITESMVIKKQKQLTTIGDAVSNGAFRVLRAVMNYACAIGLLDANPVNVLTKARVWRPNKRRTRIITVEQLKIWHEAVEGLHNHKAKVYFLLLLYMGFRSGEALTLEWSNVNMKSKTITVLDTKNHTDHTLPIPDVLIPYIKDLRDTTGHKWVFPQDDNDKYMTMPKKQLTIIIKDTGIKFSPHDLRRTFATIAEAVGLPLTMIKRLINHITANDVTGGYIITEEETLRVAINKVADYIQSKVNS